MKIAINREARILNLMDYRQEKRAYKTRDYREIVKTL